MSAEIVLFIRIVITASIYLFLALTLWALWQTTFPQLKKKDEMIPKITLINMADSTPQTFSIPEIYIGRDELANFKILDESASNLHARIFWKENNFWIEDLNSTNGTFIDEEKVIAPMQIYEGDRIHCGNAEIKIQTKVNQDNN